MAKKQQDLAKKQGLPKLPDEIEPVDFISDVYRRVLGHLPLPNEDPITFNDLIHRITPDPYTPINLATESDLQKVLRAITTNGWADEVGGGWRMTQEGLDGLRGPAKDPTRQPTRDEMTL